jgi:hypothetical protein
VVNNLEIQEQRFRSGELGQGVLLEIQRSKLEAQKRVSDAKSMLEQYRQVLGELGEIEVEFEDEGIDDTEIEDNTSKEAVIEFRETEIERTRGDSDE